MASIQITTDGTLTGTKLVVDGKEVTKDEKVVGISLYACAPYTSKYSTEPYKGSVSVSYATEDSGKISRHEYGTTEAGYDGGVGPQMKEEDSVIRYIGAAVDKSLQDLVDKIVSHCGEKNLVCPDKEALLSRSLESLTDKAMDLGITLEG